MLRMKCFFTQLFDTILFLFTWIESAAASRPAVHAAAVARNVAACAAVAEATVAIADIVADAFFVAIRRLAFGDHFRLGDRRTVYAMAFYAHLVLAAASSAVLHHARIFVLAANVRRSNRAARDFFAAAQLYLLI